MFTISQISVIIALASTLPLVIQCGAKSNAATCSMSVKDYDTSCNVDADCRGVPSIPPCEDLCHDCAQAAVSVRDFDRYMADYRSLSASHDLGRCIGCPNVPLPCCREHTCSLAFDQCSAH